jgi:uncharacterized protein (TIGR00369 family)
MHNGPFYDREREGRLERGFFVLDRHCNSFGIVHGGMVCTFLDALLAAAAYRAAGRVGVTIQLSTDFLSAARQGDWVEGDALVTKVAGELVFVEGRARSRGRDLARAHAIFKLMSARRTA